MPTCGKIKSPAKTKAYLQKNLSVVKRCLVVTINVPLLVLALNGTTVDNSFDLIVLIDTIDHFGVSKATEFSEFTILNGVNLKANTY